ncbi:DMT family transporter [Aeromicrobium sp. CF4.19]|uniref:DMT family transporter n=1 Tax=Aeromicrobium sp. CF4.19 TaxID=3373082 RepID=UPI003EE66257
MSDHSSAIVRPWGLLPADHAGLWWGFLGVLAFSFTVVLTRVAVDTMTPLFIGAGRAVVAAALAGAALWMTRQVLPSRTQWLRLCVVGGGVVIGFPLLTSFALVTAPASHGAMVIALLPAATAVMVVIRGKENPPTAFWVAAGVGAVAAVGFASVQGGRIGQPHWADLLLLGAVVAAAIGYAEGGLLARQLGAWQTVSWALVLCAPLMVVLTAIAALRDTPSGGAAEWASFVYLAVVSMFLGFFAWYRGLAIGPMARVSQIQLLQPVLSICWAVLLLREHVSWATGAGAVAVIVCAGIAVRVRLREARPTRTTGGACDDVETCTSDRGGSCRTG